MRAKPGQVIGSISAAALSFIVHEPSGIIEVVSERSRASRRFNQRIISVSEWWSLNTECWSSVPVRASAP